VVDYSQELPEILAIDYGVASNEATACLISVQVGDRLRSMWVLHDVLEKSLVKTTPTKGKKNIERSTAKEKAKARQNMVVILKEAAQKQSPNIVEKKDVIERLYSLWSKVLRETVDEMTRLYSIDPESVYDLVAPAVGLDPIKTHNAFGTDFLSFRSLIKFPTFQKEQNIEQQVTIVRSTFMILNAGEKVRPGSLTHNLEAVTLTMEDDLSFVNGLLSETECHWIESGSGTLRWIPCGIYISTLSSTHPHAHTQALSLSRTIIYIIYFYHTI
jgi:hypothetical protein